MRMFAHIDEIVANHWQISTIVPNERAYPRTTRASLTVVTIAWIKMHPTVVLVAKNFNGFPNTPPMPAPSSWISAGDCVNIPKQRLRHFDRLSPAGWNQDCLDIWQLGQPRWR